MERKLNSMKTNKSLVLYLYREDAQTLENFLYFIKFGTIESESVDYVFIINDYKCSVDFPVFKNIRIIKKDNGFDLNSYIFAIKQLELSNYDFFFFINSSCIGPILPTYTTKNWVEIFTDLFNDKIKLIAPIVEIPQDNFGSLALNNNNKFIQKSDKSIPFLHTYMFATDKVGMNILLSYEVFREHQIDQFELIHKFERLITSCILNEGYGIRSFLKRFENVDLSLKENWDVSKWSNSLSKTCPEIPKNYDGIDVHPFELIFTKSIRRRHTYRPWGRAGLSKELKNYLKNYVKWSMT